MQELAALAESEHELIRDVKDGIVFIGRAEDLELMNKPNLTLFCDGTFKYAPDHFTQMLTFFVYQKGYYIPVCHFFAAEQTIYVLQKINLHVESRMFKTRV